MKKTILILLGIFALSTTMMAQENVKKRPARVTYEQITEVMAKDLQLNEKQLKKVAKLNKKYKTLIEGEMPTPPQGQRPPSGERPSGRPSGGMGGHGGGMPGGGMPGGGMPGGGMGGPGGGMGGPGGGMRGPGGFGGNMPEMNSYDYEKQQQKYDKSIGKILSEQQYEGYQKIKPQFASQRRVRDFLFGGQQPFGPGAPED